MKEKRKRFIQIFAIALIMLLIASSTYAYFASQTGGGAQTDITITAGTVDSLTFETGEAISISATQSNFTEGSGNQSDDTYASATLVANNTTNETSAYYSIYLNIPTNEFEYTTSNKTAELLLVITDMNDNTITELEDLSYVTVTDGLGNQVSGFDITGYTGSLAVTEFQEIVSDGSVTEKWNFSVTLVNLDSDQSENSGKDLVANLTIMKSGNTLQAVSSGSYSEKIWGYKSSITSIVFDDTGSTIDIYDYVYDISEKEDTSILAYLVNNGNDTYTTYIVSELEILGNENMSYWFCGFTSLESIEIQNLNTINVINMECMFYNLSSITELDLSTFNTMNVNNMTALFGVNDGYDSVLTSITFGENWDTSNVTTMHAMFQCLSNLTSLDLTNWDTSKVTTMRSMFYNCSNLTTLDLSSFDTSNVTTMESMFSGYGVTMSLEEIIFGENWDTSNVTTMQAMFQNCANLTELDLSTWNTSKVTDMSYFLGGPNSVKKLTKITFGSGWDTSNVTNMTEMFQNLGYLKELDLSMFDTSNVTTMDYMFNNSSGILTLNLSSATFSQVTTYSNMFNDTNSSITVTVKDSDAYDFITARLAEYNGGTVVIS